MRVFQHSHQNYDFLTPSDSAEAQRIAKEIAPFFGNGGIITHLPEGMPYVSHARQYEIWFSTAFQTQGQQERTPQQRSSPRPSFAGKWVGEETISIPHGGANHLTEQEVRMAERISAEHRKNGAIKQLADYLTAFVYAQSAFNPKLVIEWGKNAITVNGVRYETEPPRNKSLVEEFRKGQKVDGLGEGLIWKAMMDSGYRYMFQQNGDDPSQWTHDRQWVAEEKDGQWTRWQKMRAPVKGEVVWIAHSLPYTN